MSFAYPNILFLLLIPLILLIRECTARGHLIPLPFDHGQQGSGTTLRILVLVANSLPPILIALGIVILARPQESGTPESKRVLTNIEFCVDVSGSMSSPFDKDTRYQAAMNAIQEFATKRKGDAFSLVIFGNAVMRWVPLTKDLSAIANATPFLRPRSLPDMFGGTEIGRAIEFSRNSLIKQEEGDRMIILLSDGHSSDLGGNRPTILSEKLKADKVTLFAIHIGEQIPEELYAMVIPTGGKVFPVHDKAGFKQIFQHIDNMRPVRMKNHAPRMVDYYRPFIIAGSVILALWVLTLFGIRFTPW